MSAGHTPGPWVWEEGQPNITKNWNGKDHQVSCVDYRKLAWHEDSNCAGRESGANARLIAAAPELLLALQRLVDNVDGGEFISITRIAEARAAIAKATGGAT